MPAGTSAPPAPKCQPGNTAAPRAHESELQRSEGRFSCLEVGIALLLSFGGLHQPLLEKAGWKDRQLWRVAKDKPTRPLPTDPLGTPRPLQRALCQEAPASAAAQASEPTSTSSGPGPQLKVEDPLALNQVGTSGSPTIETVEQIPAAAASCDRGIPKGHLGVDLSMLLGDAAQKMPFSSLLPSVPRTHRTSWSKALASAQLHGQLTPSFT